MTDSTPQPETNSENTIKLEPLSAFFAINRLYETDMISFQEWKRELHTWALNIPIHKDEQQQPRAA